MRNFITSLDRSITLTRPQAETYLNYLTCLRTLDVWSALQGNRIEEADLMSLDRVSMFDLQQNTTFLKARRYFSDVTTFLRDTSSRLSSLRSFMEPTSSSDVNAPPFGSVDMFDACTSDALNVKHVGVGYVNFILAARYLRDLVSLTKDSINGSLPSLLHEKSRPMPGLTSQSSSRALWFATIVSPIFLFWGLDISKWNIQAVDMIKYALDLFYRKPAAIVELELLIWKHLFQTAFGDVHGSTGYLNAVRELSSVNLESCKDWFGTDMFNPRNRMPRTEPSLSTSIAYPSPLISSSSISLPVNVDAAVLDDSPTLVARMLKAPSPSASSISLESGSQRQSVVVRLDQIGSQTSHVLALDPPFASDLDTTSDSRSASPSKMLATAPPSTIMKPILPLPVSRPASARNTPESVPKATMPVPVPITPVSITRPMATFEETGRLTVSVTPEPEPNTAARSITPGDLVEGPLRLMTLEPLPDDALISKPVTLFDTTQHVSEFVCPASVAQLAITRPVSEHPIPEPVNSSNKRPRVSSPSPSPAKATGKGLGFRV
ncbi:hypothetical protein CVT24_010599 [Panaeolus cyanescens]|uniref:Uncharacterized protein n=1 Tax=Panaeolus cyanescens TaxID=181874 RepID=A0A409YM55_9AGAR|nr:hypothetical protein CVT24_010599 [Panaeolus cyanescens]